FIEQTNAYRAYNQNLNWSDPANLPVTSQRLAIYQCPSSPSPERLDGAPEQNYAGIVATGDYAALYGVDTRLVSLGLVPNAGEGLASKTNKIRIADATDGLSNTVHTTESAGRPALYRTGKLINSNAINGGGWSRPASEIWLVGSSSDGSTLPGSCGI